ncbi:hypothetical protein DFP90_1301 [Aestuariispira insulae]|uniref:Uncharacterized protein n=1 Tax=Aestuariispira insulae TaxID=1461337 RepID=A0A3D9H1C9_9PROT|nr:hypothetical protein DFP90_1301 [Aestuariispira insulae]
MTETTDSYSQFDAKMASTDYVKAKLESKILSADDLSPRVPPAIGRVVG